MNTTEIKITEASNQENAEYFEKRKADEIIADKTIRVELDATLQKLKSLMGSRERSISITKIQEAVMWLGMDLKRLNDVNPYPNSYNTANTIVEKTADGLKL